MKKLLFLIVVLMTTFGLAACASSSNIGEIPQFKESDIIELSAQEMIELFETLEYSTSDIETMRMSASGSFKVSESYEGWGYSENSQYEATFDVVIYTRVAPQATDIRLHATGEVDFLVNEQRSYTGDGGTETYINGFAGSVAAYLINQYLYLNVDGTLTEDGVEEEIQFKQKISEQLAQADWEDMYDEDNVDDLDYMLPTEITDLLESDDLDAIMEAIPNLKVYKDGQTHSIVFSIDKQGILDNLLDMLRAVAEEVDPTITEDDIQEAYTEAVAEINAVVDELEFLYVISIKDNKVTKVAIDVYFLSDAEDIEIDITIVIDMNVELPKYPNDLDDYEVVDYPGEGVID